MKFGEFQPFLKKVHKILKKIFDKGQGGVYKADLCSVEVLEKQANSNAADLKKVGKILFRGLTTDQQIAIVRKPNKIEGIDSPVEKPDSWLVLSVIEHRETKREDSQAAVA